jgi:imidazolonepropionase
MIHDGSLLIRDGVIDEVGTTRRVENLAPARDAVEISASGRVVMPGFVDSHTHLLFPPAGTADHDHTGAVRSIRASTGQRLHWRAQTYLEAMARHGTTTVEAKTGCGPDESAETKLLRVLAALKDNPLHVVPTFLLRLPHPDVAGARTVEESAEWVFREFLPKIRRRRFARFADLVCDAGPEWPGLSSRYFEAARQLGLACKLHADQAGSAGAIATAVRHFAASVDHLEYAGPDEVALLAGSGTMATLLPLASFCNGGRMAPARALIEAGVAVALASNFNPVHTPVMNMQTVIALACKNLKMTTAEAVSAATINGAHALGRAERVGSLEVGKLANLVILNTADYRELAQQFGTNLVHVTMKRGKMLYREGDVAARPPENLSLRTGWD